MTTAMTRDVTPVMSQVFYHNKRKSVKKTLERSVFSFLSILIFIYFPIKVCYIEYEPQAFNETVEVCRTPVIKDCNNDGGNREQICRTVYETECWTKHNVHEVEDDVVSCETVQEDVCQDVVEGYLTSSRCKQFPKEKCSLEKKKVKKVTPETGCNKEPVEVCAPRGCGFVNVSLR